jgi:hypothetical protein
MEPTMTKIAACRVPCTVCGTSPWLLEDDLLCESCHRMVGKSLSQRVLTLKRRSAYHAQEAQAMGRLDSNQQTRDAHTLSMAAARLERSAS